MKQVVDSESQSRFKRWRSRQKVSPEDRRRVLQAVAIRANEGWWLRFGVMFALSVVIATTGLSQNSAAVVIGAMLVAPLMAPILGFAVGLAMGSVSRALRSFSVVALAAAGGVALAWMLGSVWQGDPLTSEVMARTSPDVRDLLVALAAGAAAAYATIREDISGSLPGAGVAVALVPPLATIGLTLRAGRSDLSSGAFLLFIVNVTAIVLASVVVFLATGFVPPALVSKRRHRVGIGTALAIVVAVGVTVPLLVTTDRLAKTSRQRTSVDGAVSAWLVGSDLELVRTRITGTDVTIDLVGPSTPPELAPLEASLAAILGHPVTVKPRWTQRTLAGEATAVEVQLDAQIVRPILEQWIAEQWSSGNDAVVTALSVDPSTIGLEIESTEAPPGADSLAALVEERTGAKPSVNIRWTQKEQPVRTDERKIRTQLLANTWAVTQEGQIDVTAVHIDEDAGTVTVDMVGESPVPDASGLRADLAVAVPELRAVLRYTVRTELTDPTTSTTVQPASGIYLSPDAPPLGADGQAGEAPVGGAPTGGATTGGDTTGGDRTGGDTVATGTTVVAAPIPDVSPTPTSQNLSETNP